jgi:hypothetical protein
MVQPVSSDARFNLMSGVLPIASMTSLLIFICGNLQSVAKSGNDPRAFSVPMESERGSRLCFDAFSSREPVPTEPVIGRAFARPVGSKTL